MALALSEKIFVCLMLASLMPWSMVQGLIPRSGANEPLPTTTILPATTTTTTTTTSPTSATTTKITRDPITTSTTTTTTSSTKPVEEDSSNFEFTSNQGTSTFSCEGKMTGYYADVKLKCRVYHFCTQLDSLEGPTYQRMSYMCLDDSYFDQKDLNCVRESDMKVPCHKAEAEFEKSNKQFDPKEDTPPSMRDSLTANIMMNPIARYIAGR